MGKAKEVFADRLQTLEGKLVHSAYLTEDDRLDRVLLDNYLLGECDEVILTAGSSFGAIAMARKGFLPWYITSDNSEPCNLANEDLSPGKLHALGSSIMW
jgi:hypothetical protein